MAEVTKLVIRKGVYQAPQGQFRATAKRLKHFEEQHKAMRKAGIQVSCSWGHQKQALPCEKDRQAESSYWLSKFNAGTIDDLTVRPDGGFSMKADIPGCELKGDKLCAWTKLPDGREVLSAIGEVSAAIGDWRDGKGKLWKDVVRHVALTPMPVVHGTGGFAPASATLATSQPDDEEGVTYLSLSTFLTELGGAMAANPFDKTDDEEEEGAEEETPGTAGEETAPKTPPDALVATPAPAAPTAPVQPDADAAKLVHVIELLKECNGHPISLPPNTTPENLIHNLEIACYALKGAGKGKDDEEEEDDDAVNSPGGGDAAYEQEQRPVMMSTITLSTEGLDPIARKSIQERQDRRRRRGAKLIAKCVALNLMDPPEAARLSGLCQSYTLACTEEGEVVEQPVDVELGIYEKILAKSPQAARASVAAGKRVPRPDGLEHDKVSEKDLDERAARVVPARR